MLSLFIIFDSEHEHNETSEIFKMQQYTVLLKRNLKITKGFHSGSKERDLKSGIKALNLCSKSILLETKADTFARLPKPSFISYNEHFEV
jgi:hypothetical protein